MFEFLQRRERAKPTPGVAGAFVHGNENLIELRTQIEHMQEKAAEWALHVSNFKDGQEEGPSSVDPDQTPVPFTPEQIAAKEAELKALDGKQDLEKQIEQKTKLAQSYRIDDINVRFPLPTSPPLLQRCPCTAATGPR